jgi:hypothetical protein
MLEAAEAAWHLCTLFGVPMDFAMAPDELEEQADELVEWRVAQTSDNIKIQVDMADQEGVVEGQSASYLWFLSLELGKYELIAAAVVEGDVQFVETRARIAARPIYARRWVIERKQRNAWVLNDFPRLVHQLACELETKGKGLDLNNLITPDEMMLG